MNTRQEFWLQPRRYPLRMLGNDKHGFVNLVDRVRSSQEYEVDYSAITYTLEPAKELLFDFDEEGELFLVIGIVVDVEEFFFEIAVVEEIRVETNETLLSVLAVADGLDLPVLPNRQEAVQPLMDAYRRLLSEGARVTSTDGKRATLRLQLDGVINSELLAESPERVASRAKRSTIQLAVLHEAYLEERARLTIAKRAVERLSVGIRRLVEVLAESADKRDEHRLQRCLTENPILFGPQYEKVIPKHRLGGEYEMDYALQRADGVIDLVEIEPSTISLFTKKGRPRSELIHAEQQILDWQAWLAKNHWYAKRSLPISFRPTGIVIIGRDHSLSSDDHERLKQRNTLFKGALEVLTYDALLQRARTLNASLLGQ